MNFPDAMRAVIKGDRVTRVAWNDRMICLFLDGGLLKIRKADRSLHALLVSDGDMLAEDWIVVYEN